MSTSSRSTQQLAEFVAAISAAENEASAGVTAVELVAEALDADVAVIACAGEVVAAVGYPEGTAPADELELVKPGATDASLEVPGVGTCAAAAAALDHPPHGTLVIARRDALTREEDALLRGMARAASMAMRMLRVLDDERAAREEVERLAGEQAALRRVATLVASGVAADELFAAVAEELARLLHATITWVLRYEPDRTVTVVGGWSVPGPEIPIGGSLSLEGEGVAITVKQTGLPVRTERFVGPPGSASGFLQRLGAKTGVGSPIMVDGVPWGVTVAAFTWNEPLAADSETRITRFTELVATAIANTEARTELRRFADEQEALRRLATLVASGAPPDNVFAAVAEEVGNALPEVDLALIARYDYPAIDLVAGWARRGDARFVGTRARLGGDNVATLVFERNAPARVDRFADDANEATALAIEWARSAAGAPINVEGHLWGVMTVASGDEYGLPPGIEHWLADFVELVATAIANTEARTELRALVDEQAALRRVATLVASGAPTEAVFAAVGAEVCGLLPADVAMIGRYDGRDTVVGVGGWNRTGEPFEAGVTITIGGRNVTTFVVESGRPMRLDSYEGATGVPADQARTLGLHASVGAPVSVEGRLWGVVVVSSTRDAFPPHAEERLANFAELVATAIANAEARAELRLVADEQSALRRVATLVARGEPPARVFAAVAAELGHVIPDSDYAMVGRYGTDRTSELLGVWSRLGEAPTPGTRTSLEGESATALVFETGRPARVDDYTHAAGAAAASGRAVGVRSSVGAPIIVDGNIWGLMLVATTKPTPLPPWAEQRLSAFTELAATAIANAQAQAELTASRARIVATADETRRRIERDLHDGAQQRLVSLALQLRAAQAAVPSGLGELAAEIDDVAGGLTAALDELREFARGIHPAILAEGGLAPALETLALRSAVPVELTVAANGRLAEAVEVAAYYVVSEALANAAKHARASRVVVEIEADVGVLHVRVRDDGAGGADLAGGSGLVGLKDRVEALGGQIMLRSDPGAGTTVSVELPLNARATVGAD